MRRIISALLFCVSSTWALAQSAQPIELAPDAPDRHIVVPGDTLWGISAKFLKNPYRWPDIWRMNKDEVKNPHRIYPGQVIVLDREERRLRLGPIVKMEPRIRCTDAQGKEIVCGDDRREIPAIPTQIIEPFLSQPLVIEADSLDASARVVAPEEGHLILAAGNRFYATNVKDEARSWQIFRPGRMLVDPDDKERVLGQEASYIGTARLLKSGEPATMQIASSRQEVSINDHLLPAPKPDVMNYVPRVPEKLIEGRIVDVHGSAGVGAAQSIVAISRGRKDGLEVGHVLALMSSGAEVGNRFKDQPEAHRLPKERIGLVFVFRVFDNVAYALVMQSSRQVSGGDAVRTP